VVTEFTGVDRELTGQMAQKKGLFLLQNFGKICLESFEISLSPQKSLSAMGASRETLSTKGSLNIRKKTLSQ